VKNVSKEIKLLAEKNGFVLVRKRKHFIFKHPSGAVLVASGSTTDWRALHNIESQIKKLLSL
jgi:predicted RNA binding protein YcfA (HicA-like mRNA interferase family)